MNDDAGTNAVSFEDRFTGCLLGMAIGDALGTPRAYLPQEQFPASPAYAPRPDVGGEIEIPAGQYSLNSELALCLLETLTTSNGFIDPELALFRFENAASHTPYLAEQRELDAIQSASESEEYQSGGNAPSNRYAGPAARIVPVALVHSLSDLNVALLTREVLRATLITDADPSVVNGALAVAHAIRLTMRDEIPLEMLIDEVVSMIDEDDVARAVRNGGGLTPDAAVAAVVSSAMHAFVWAGGELLPALSRAFSSGGATHLIGAITGALCGAHVGASRIEQNLIDGLDGRAYILMAAPALLRTAQLRAGLVFQLRLQ